MKKIFNITYILLAVGLLTSACKKNDYFIGGDLHNAQVGVSTYDFLKNNDRGLFDTLLMIVDAAGVKDKINKEGITFFAPTDYAINAYVEARTLRVQKVDPFKKWTVDSIMKYELESFADSIEVYIVPKRVGYADLNENGKIFATQNGAESVISYEETDDPKLGYNPNSNFYPQIVYYTYLFAPLSEPFIASEIPAEVGIRARVQTSGVESTTGMVNVLGGGHRLFFYR